MKTCIKIIAGIALLLFCRVPAVWAQSFRSYETRVQGITYRIDPRIELFNAVAMLFGNNDMTQVNIPYKQEMLSRFAPFKNHPVVDSVYNTYRYGWGVDGPIFFMLSLDDNFNILPGLTSDQIKSGGGMAHLKRLAALFKDFAQKSHFYSWFNDVERPFYEQVIAQTRYNFRDFRIVPLLEKYYGERQHAYITVLNLSGGYGNFGHAFTRNGKTDLYAVIETGTSAGEVPVFAPSVPLFTLIVHEFSHGFVNPAVDPYIAAVDQDSALYEPIKDAMQASGYYSWRTTVYETIVPAAVIRMAAQYYGKDFAQQEFYRPAMGRRFIYLDTLLDRLAYYETHRQQFATFGNFVPQLLKVFDGISPAYISHLQQEVADIRKPNTGRIPRPTEFAHDSTAYFIIGTHEKDTAAQNQMEAWARKYQGMISPKSPMITDDQALKTNLAGHDIVLIGTPEGNALLARCIGKLPIKILKDSVLTNKIIRGNHLQVVTSWVSPFDPNRTMVIYTAQQTMDINKFETSPYKEQYGYWVGENTITLDKGEWRRYNLIW